MGKPETSEQSWQWSSPATHLLSLISLGMDFHTIGTSSCSHKLHFRAPHIKCITMFYATRLDMTKPATEYGVWALLSSPKYICLLFICSSLREVRFIYHHVSGYPVTCRSGLGVTCWANQWLQAVLGSFRARIINCLSNFNLNTAWKLQGQNWRPVHNNHKPPTTFLPALFFQAGRRLILNRLFGFWITRCISLSIEDLPAGVGRQDGLLTPFLPLTAATGMICILIFES